MDTGDPPHEDAPKVPVAVKGKKKKKEGKKTLTLDQFLAQDDGYSEPKSQNWAILSENPDDDYDAPIKFDRSTLPTAPKAALGPKVDISQIPKDGPFSAYVGNIPYDAKETDLLGFFSKMDVDTVRIIYDGGRPKGYAYVDFKNRESLLEALSYHDKEYMGRSIRVDLATEKNQDSRGGRPNEPDRTEGDWRRRNPASDMDSSSDRGSRFGDRDRGFSDRDKGGGGGFSDRSQGERDRGFGDRDRGFGDRDRGFGGDRDRGFGGDRDRGFGGDRERGFSDRDRGGGFSDRDRGFGGDRDRGFGGDRDRGFGGDRDRGFGGERSSRGYGFNRESRDRDEGGRFGSRGGGSGGGGFDDRFGGRRDEGRRDEGRRDDFNRGRRDDNFDRKPASRDGSQEHKDGTRERPVLNLKPRTKPVEKENQPVARSSIFGAAKPVDTYAREKEIEEKLKKKDDVEYGHPTSKRRDSESSDHGRKSGERYSGGENRRESGDGSAPVSRRDSEHSRTSDDGGGSDDVARSSTSASKQADAAPRMVPAPPPKENVWVKKKEDRSLSSSSSDTSNVSNNARVSSPTSTTPLDKRESAPPKSGAGSRGRGAQTGTDAPQGRKPTSDKASNSHNGPPAKRSDNPKTRPPKDKTLPKTFEDMPKFEDTKSKDFSDKNKFAFLLDNENEGEERGNEDGEPQDFTS